jgi:hypothetical protein
MSKLQGPLGHKMPLSFSSATFSKVQTPAKLFALLGQGRPTTEGRIGVLSIRGVKDPQPSAPVLAMFRERIAVTSMRSFRAGYWQRLMAQLITWGLENQRIRAPA